MKNNEVVRIAIAETSVIIRGGLTAALKRLSNVKVQPIELLSVEARLRPNAMSRDVDCQSYFW